MEYPECVDADDRIVVVGKDGQRGGRLRVTCPNCRQKRYIGVKKIHAGLKENTFTGLCHSCYARHSSDRCKNQRGKRNPFWKGGKHIDSCGYILCTVQPSHRFFCMANRANGISEHRLVMAEHLGRPLSRKEHCHHIDGNRLNNHIDNLALMTSSNHSRFENLLNHGKVERKDVLDYVLERK